MTATPVLPDPKVHAALSAYAEQARRELGFETSGIVSYAGIWLLLATLAPVARGAAADRLADILGLPVQEAAQVAARLAAAPHQTISAALGAWAREGISVPLATEPLPDQARLDAWASEHTRGLIRTFPIRIKPGSAFVAASALVLQPRWRTSLRRYDAVRMLLTDGLMAVVETEAAGPVALAMPHSPDGVDVISVQAAPEVEPDEVWAALAEVCARLNAGERLDGHRPRADGHSWTVATETQFLMPGDPEQPWKALLREWGAEARHDVLKAPGVAEAVAALRAAEPQLDGDVECAQSAIAEYGEDGFRAAAVTAIDMRVTAAPMFEERQVEVITLDFDRAHAVTAIGRGGEWEGLRLFDAWVRPDLPH